MNIQFTKEQFLQIASESSFFREVLWEKLNSQPLEEVLKNYADQIRKRFHPAKDKISAIKWIREETRGKEKLKIFSEKGFDFYQTSFGNQSNVLSLSAAKKFVEMAFDYLI